VRDSAALLQTAFDLIPFDIYVVDVETHSIVYINQHMREALGGTALDEPCWQTIYHQDQRCLHCKIPALMERVAAVPTAAEIFEHYHEGRETWFHLTEKCMRWPDGRMVKYSFAVDISQLKVAQNSLAEAHAQLSLHAREVKQISITDHLTGAYTRRHLDEVLMSEISRASRSGNGFAVILCDLDRFKSVNDQFGHRAGDKLMIQTVALIKKTVRKIDVLGRWGGEEFIIVLPEIGDLAGAVAAAEKLRHAIEREDFGAIGPRSASFGVAVHHPGETAEHLVERADQALYRAKAGGRNRVES
jgi:diguanylate cyclase (GGDEF)-like protein